ncbi:MAG: hypothetical protein AAFN68_08195 [Pseudomonadota bacterium]
MNRLLSLIFLSLSFSTSAALPPSAQNVEDLEAMLEFIKKHRTVAAHLKSIDMESFTVHFGDNCHARFDRKFVARPHGWVGPQAPLVFKSVSCPIEK